MYIDSVIIASLIVIALMIWMMVYIGIYAYRHFQSDARKNNENPSDEETLKKLIQHKQIA